MIFCSKPQKFTWRNAITLLLLLTAGSILILLLIPSGSWFGSETDWYSQHVTIADYMRKNFYATGSLFPDFTGILEAEPISFPSPTTDLCARMY